MQPIEPIEHARPGRTARAMLIPFTVVVACFVASSFVAQRAARNIDEASRGITLNAAPSIERLAAARSGLRNVEELLTEWVAEPTFPRRADVTTRRREVDADLRAYLRLPSFAGERGLWLDVETELSRFDTALDHVIRCFDASDVVCARSLLHGEMRTATDHVDAAAVRVIAFNATNAHDLAQHIASMREHAEHVAWVLDALSVALAGFTAWIVLRAAGRYERLRESHRALAERRADEFEQFASRVAHDVLGPLTTVGLALQMLERADVPLSDRLRKPVAGAMASLRRVRAIVDGLLEFARAGASPVDGARAEITDVVADVISSTEPQAADRKVDLAVEPFEPCAVACSTGVLTSLLSNLVRNAIKYVGDEPGRRVRVRIARMPGEGRVRFEVEDNGPGVPPSLVPTVFEPYVRAPNSRQPGIGLGLATVKKLAKAHAGDVGLESRPGGGSVFWFVLPRATAVTPG